MVLVLLILVPAVIAGLFGLRARRDQPVVIAEFCVGAMWAIGWAFGSVLLWQGLWISAAGVQGDASIYVAAFYWTAVSALIWFPVLMISYVAFAMRARRA